MPYKGPLIKSHAVATAAFREGMREARCSKWSHPLASRATKQTARKAIVPSGCGKMRRLRCCAPRLRSPGYDLRRAPRIHPHFASNAIYGGLNRRFLNIRLAGTLTREQKRKIAEEVTNTLERIAHKPKSYTYVAFDELRDENWAIAGKLLDE
jgi:4-oxalocrotonate tautomerase